MPNKVVNCRDGSMKIRGAGYVDCVVPNKPANMTDVFPVQIVGESVVPMTNAAMYVLNSAK